ncbi:MAG TPA: DNA polymerase III subunit beta [Bosea sp. (in: a-proteobacteria)]
MSTDFVTVEGRSLRQATHAILDIVERRNTIPILSMVKLTHSSAGLVVEGTDLDIFIRATVDPIDGAGDWTVCVDSRVLDSIANLAGPAPLRIEPGDIVKIALGDGDASYEIQTLPASDFPEVGAPATALLESFTNGMLAASLDKVRWCVSTVETRYYLNGVFWQMNDRGRCFVATDGHRLSACRYTSEAGSSPGYIIPRKTVAFIAKHFAGKDVKVSATASQFKLVFQSGGITLTSKMIDGTFPDYQRVIPGAPAVSFPMKRAELLDAIARTGVLSTRERGRAIRFHNDDGCISIEKKNPDFGSAKARTSAAWPGEQPEFGFNGAYMLDVARNCEGDLSFEMTAPSAPFKIMDADPTMTRVIMPMRV